MVNWGPALDVEPLSHKLWEGRPQIYAATYCCQRSALSTLPIPWHAAAGSVCRCRSAACEHVARALSVALTPAGLLAAADNRYHPLLSTSEIAWTHSGFLRHRRLLQIGNERWEGEEHPGYPCRICAGAKYNFVAVCSRGIRALELLFRQNRADRLMAPPPPRADDRGWSCGTCVGRSHARRRTRRWTARYSGPARPPPAPRHPSASLGVSPVRSNGHLLSACTFAVES